MKLSDVIGVVLVATAVVLLALCGWGLAFGHVGAYRISWWATAAGFAGLAAFIVSPRTRV